MQRCKCDSGDSRLFVINCYLMSIPLMPILHCITRICLCHLQKLQIDTLIFICNLQLSHIPPLFTQMENTKGNQLVIYWHTTIHPLSYELLLYSLLALESPSLFASPSPCPLPSCCPSPSLSLHFDIRFQCSIQVVFIQCKLASMWKSSSNLPRTSIIVCTAIPTPYLILMLRKFLAADRSRFC